MIIITITNNADYDEYLRDDNLKSDGKGMKYADVFFMMNSIQFIPVIYPALCETHIICTQTFNFNPSVQRQAGLLTVFMSYVNLFNHFNSR